MLTPTLNRGSGAATSASVAGTPACSGVGSARRGTVASLTPGQRRSDVGIRGEEARVQREGVGTAVDLAVHDDVRTGLAEQGVAPLLLAGVRVAEEDRCRARPCSRRPGTVAVRERLGVGV